MLRGRLRVVPCSSNSCCGENPELLARALGYGEEELRAIPREANLGLSCGNPLAFALLEAGQVVVIGATVRGWTVFSQHKRWVHRGESSGSI